MRFPKFKPVQRSRQAVTVFGGYNHNPVIGDGEWWDMKNMTSDHYPLLAPEMKGTTSHLRYSIEGMVSNNGMCTVRTDETGTKFVIEKESGDVEVGVELTGHGPRQLIAMGAYVIILPDKKWVNVAACLDNGSEEADKYGSIEAEFYRDTLSVAATDKNGSYIDFQAATIRPEDPKDGDMWLDISQAEPVLKKWYKASAMWMEEQSYVALGDDDQYGNFKEGDCLVGKAIKKKVDNTNAYLSIPENPVVLKAGEDSRGSYIVVKGVFSFGSASNPSYAEVTGVNAHWTRKMPDLDYMIESGNRLWGCKYGQTDDGFINEICASKLGDFKNWNSFQGVSTDSYRASLGADGKFTGAVNYNGKPIFFKDDCMTVVYGAYPAQYQVSTIECNGVQDGCSKSLSIVNNKLYYWSRSGVCLYDGSLPVTISAALGSVKAETVVSGSINNKLYMNVLDVNNKACCYVLDTMHGLWHKIEGMTLYGVCAHDGGLYFWVTIKSDDDPPQYTSTLWNVSAPGDESREWFVESGDIGLTTIDAKYISQLTVRMALTEGSQVVFRVKYDFEDEWHYLTTIIGTNLRTFDVPIRPKRCDTMRLRIEGVGDAKIYAIVKTMEQGGDSH